MDGNNIYDLSDLNSPVILHGAKWRIALGATHGCDARMRKIIYVIPEILNKDWNKKRLWKHLIY